MTFTPIPAGTTNWSVPLNAALTDLQNQITSLYSNDWGPDDQGMLAWSIDPATASSTQALTGGVLALCRFRIRTAVTANSLATGVSTAGSGLTSNQNFMGIYNAAGTLLRSTADLSAVWNSSGAKNVSLTSSVSLSAGYYYFALLSNGTTPPTLIRGSSSTNGIINIGTTSTTLRFATYGSGLTTLPSSLTLASMVASGVAYAVGVL